MLEFFGALIGLGLLVFGIVIPIVAWVRSRRAMRLVKQNQESSQALTQRVRTLETQVEEIQFKATQKAFALDMALQQLKEVSTKLDGVTPGAAAAPAPLQPPVAATEAVPPAAEPPRPAAGVTPPHPRPPLPPTAT